MSAAAAVATLTVGLAAVPAAEAATTAKVAGNVPSYAVASAKQGAANGSGRLTVSVYLADRNQTALNQLLKDLYNPRSSRYHKFLSPAQFRAAYAPATADVSAVKSFLGGKGLKVAYSPANHAFVDATGSVAQVAKAFAVTQSMYRYKGHLLRANAEAPTIPAALSSKVLFVGGLDDSELLLQPSNTGREGKQAPPGEGYSTPGPCSTPTTHRQATVTPPAYQYGATIPWTPCGYTPPQVRTAYGLPADWTTSPLNGHGIRVGITDAFASPTIQQDLDMYSDNYGLPHTTIEQHVTPGTYSFPENRFDPQGWYGEQSLDVDAVHSMAPLATIVYAGGNNSNTPLDHALIDMIDNHRADVISNSWGIYGDPKQFGKVKSDELAFEQAAATGISVLFSSGDNGDVAKETGLAQGSWPATSPYVTAVGGTSLLYGSSGSKQEYGWGTYTSYLSDAASTDGYNTVTGSAWSPWPPAFQYGSGGGLSQIFGRPDYQTGVVSDALATHTVTSSGASYTYGSPRRVTPDVAMLADPNTGMVYGETYAISGDPLTDAGCTTLSSKLEYCERRIGGTSLASPLFAGVLALVDQARHDNSLGDVGFANPALYTTARGGLVDVLAPSTPTAVLRNVEADPTTLLTSMRTVNSVPIGTTGPVIEGADTSLRTTTGYDNVTGLGRPAIPTLVSALGG
jgi:subtilase family serine protease